MPRFADRRDAGRALGARLAGSVHGDVLVLGLPRGGAVVAGEVAAALGAPPSFRAVGGADGAFAQTTGDEVRELLHTSM